MKERSLAPRLLALCFALLIAEPFWLLGAVHTPELPNPDQVSLTKEQQEQLGLKAMAQVYQQMPVLPDSSPVTKVRSRIGQEARPGNTEAVQLALPVPRDRAEGDQRLCPARWASLHQRGHDHCRRE